MYYKKDPNQLGIEDFFLPFGGKLNKENRWVQMAGIMPWDQIERVYLESMNEDTGRPAFTARMLARYNRSFTLFTPTIFGLVNPTKASLVLKHQMDSFPVENFILRANKALHTFNTILQ